jgi:hypothetical protein
MLQEAAGKNGKAVTLCFFNGEKLNYARDATPSQSR